jgi:hypothetical protein
MTIPYLLQTAPIIYTGVPCTSIEDMVSINLLQLNSISSISYEIGTTPTVRIPVQIKNLTNNAQLAVEMNIDNKAFFIDSDENLFSKNFIVNPGEDTTIVLTLNNSELSTSINHVLSSINLKVTNLNNGTVVTKNATVTKLNDYVLEDTIEVLP